MSQKHNIDSFDKPLMLFNFSKKLVSGKAQ